MCGIAGVHRLTDRSLGTRLDRLATELFRGIEHRGKDATGFAALGDNGLVRVEKAPVTASAFETFRRRVPVNTRTLLLHTRLATQGPKENRLNNHPVGAGPVYCVHNGHIVNDAEAFTLAGRKRRAEVDSEAIPALVYAKGWESARDAFEKLEGNLAVAMFDKRRPGDLLLARGEYSPLYVLRTRHLLVWASTEQTILNAWAKVMGTPPSRSRIEYVHEGTMLRVSDGHISTERFEVPFNYAATWKAAKTYTGTSSDGSVTTRHGSAIAERIAQRLNEAAEAYDARQAASRLLTWREGTEGGGLVYDDRESRENRLLDPFDGLDMTDEVESYDGDLVRCDDCGDWYGADLMRDYRIGLAGGFSNVLCPACADWAREAGMAH